MADDVMEQAMPVPAPSLRFPWSVAWALLAVGCAGTLLLALDTGTDLGPTRTVLVLGLLQVANYRASGWLSVRFQTPVWQLDAALVTASLVLLEPVGVVAVMTVGVAIGCLLDRRSFNAGAAMTLNMLVMTAAASALTVGLGGDAPQTSAQMGLAVAISMLVGQVLWEAGISAWMRFAADEDFLASFTSALRFGLPRLPLIASLGYTAAIAATVVPLAGLFAVPALGAMVYVLAVHFRAEHDRERAEALYRVAKSAHSSIDSASVATALTEAASAMLNGSPVELRTTPPAADEIGVPLERADAQWLVAADATGGAEATQMLVAVAAIGSTALENARMADELRHQAVHDALTDLPNQLLFSDRVSQSVGSAGRQRERFAVIAIDLDDFRKVNDSLGHASRRRAPAGDRGSPG